MHYPMVVAMLLLPLGKPVIQPEELQGWQPASHQRMCLEDQPGEMVT
jgi:hypothetical protein